MATKSNNTLATTQQKTSKPLAPANQKTSKPLAQYEEDNAKGYDQLAGGNLQETKTSYDQFAAVQAIKPIEQLAPAPQDNPWWSFLTRLFPVQPKPNGVLQQYNGKPFDALFNARLAARSDQLRGYQGRSDQLQQRGFGTNYAGFGGTQYKGWGGYGGGDGGGGYGYGGDYPDTYNPWMNYMMGLNNWQI